MSRIEDRVAELGLGLPPRRPPFASFQPVVIVHGLAFVAGQPPLLGDEKPYTGRVGAELTMEEGPPG